MSGIFSRTNGAQGVPLEHFCRAETLLAAILGGVGVALLLALAPGVAGGRLTYLGLEAFFILWVVVLTSALLCLARKLLHRLSSSQAAWLAMLALQLVSFVAGWSTCALLGRALGEDCGDFLLRVSAIAWVVGLMGLLLFAVYVRMQRLTLAAKEAELTALHARIRPHFLFNTLNAATALVHGRAEQAEGVLEDLAELFRAALAGPRLVPLADELDWVRRYLAIESLRLEDRLRVRWIVPDPLPEVMVPSLSIQPLVENAVRHGVEPLRTGGEVVIAVEDQGERVMIQVTNPLPASAPAPGHGMGLHNVRARLQALTGGRGRLETLAYEGVFEARLVVGPE